MKIAHAETAKRKLQNVRASGVGTLEFIAKNEWSPGKTRT